MLANAGARSVMIYPTCVTAALQKQSLIGCAPSDLLSITPNVPPALYWGGLTPTLGPSTTSTNPLTVTASLPAFTMIMPIWGTSLNAPSATTAIPF